MSNRNKTIYNLTASSFGHIVQALGNTGKQFIGTQFSIGDHPITVVRGAKHIPPGRFTINHSRGVKKTVKVINIFELKNGTWLYSTPHYKLKKVNGTTQKSIIDSWTVIPVNAKSVFQVQISWDDTWSLEDTTLEITRYMG